MHVMSDPASLGKVSRARIATVLIVLAGAVMVSSAIWFVTRERALTGLDGYVSMLRTQGYQIGYERLALSGFPFRLHLCADQVKVQTPSGWAFSTPRVEALSLTYTSGHWVVALPAPVTVTRPVGGAFTLQAQSLSVSLADLQSPVWRIGLTAQGVRVTTPPGAAPFSLSSADRLTLNTRKSPTVKGAAEALVQIVNASATPKTAFYDLIGARRASAALAVRMSASEQFQGLGWRASGRRWVRARGRLSLNPTAPPGDDLRISTTGGVFNFDRLGHATGSLPLTLQDKAGVIKQVELVATPDRIRLGSTLAAPAPNFF